ncbi:S-adenosyl-L-methionine-dependent methyltransferase [Periconia macrospinosa]|uniref:S-adenosyl-L-methionine-dependent methyltransferase n=1 Tax=Periconia macrospinosa TaxID=97972 RepID=A0A2V1E7B8_9PLEO|nr:S-adenosyl-L-methionine-dependent methyltransferase [Periconia macrospinosa]
MKMASEEDLKVYIHERFFQKYSVDRRIYCVPVDEDEENRLETQHDILLRFFEDKLFLAPIEYPEKVLECGYGRGHWVVQVAEEYEDCEVLGIDIFTENLPEQPENLELSGYNLNDRLNDAGLFERNAYDLIHSRFVGQGIKSRRWESYVLDMRRLLKPGGWLEMMEYYPNIQSDSGLLSDRSALTQWWNNYVDAMERCNRSPRIGQRLKSLMMEAGLRNVYGTRVSVPIGEWPSDATRASIGRDMIGMVGALLTSLAIWPFTEKLGWTVEQVKALTDAAQRELRDPRLKLYMPVYYAYGRR